MAHRDRRASVAYCVRLLSTQPVSGPRIFLNAGTVFADYMRLAPDLLRDVVSDPSVEKPGAAAAVARMFAQEFEQQRVGGHADPPEWLLARAAELSPPSNPISQ